MVSSERDILTMNAWKWKCGLPEDDYTKPIRLDYDSLYETEWSNEFENLMHNRLVMGAFRYGRIREPRKKKYDRVSNIIERINVYKETGNMELLVDVANLCLLEFELSDHPNKHFESVDDADYHTKSI